MPLERESRYPNRRTYVLKLRADARPEALEGRLENVVTGERRDFRGAAELVEAIAADLAAGAGR